MKRIAFCLMLVSTLVACSPAQQQQAQMTVAEIESIVGQVQQDAVAACKYIPTVATIVGLLNAGVGATAGAITAAVCAAITPKPTARSAEPMVGSVKVTGWHVQ